MFSHLQKVNSMSSGASVKKKFIYIHIPKCAGTSLSTILFRNDKSIISDNFHSPLEVYTNKPELKEIYDEMFKFSIVRNPFDRLVSAFLYNVEKIIDPHDYHWNNYEYGYNLIRQYLCSGSMIDNFNSFVLSSDFNKISEPGFPVHFKPQVYFLMTKGSLDLDFIGRFENLESDFKIICRKIGIKPVTLPHSNKSYSLPHYRHFYDSKSYAVVREKYYLDCRFFDYS